MSKAELSATSLRCVGSSPGRVRWDARFAGGPRAASQALKSVHSVPAGACWI